MQTTVETTEKHTVKLTVEIAPDEYAKELDATYRSIANQVKIPGFRKGKVPKQIIDAQIGRDVVRDEFLEHAVPQYYRQAVSEQDLAPIADPEIDLEGFTDDSPLVFTATVEVRPRLELAEADYTGLKVTRPAATVTEADVDEWIDRLRERFAELEPADRPVIEGDFVTIDVKAMAGGDEIDGLTRTDYLYFVGSGEFGAVARRAARSARSPATSSRSSEEMGPGAGEELAGKTADLTVLVKDVKARRLPEADDDFAKTASEFDTLEQLRDDLRTRLGEMKEREATAALRDRVLDAMVDCHRRRHPRDADRRRDRAPRDARRPSARSARVSPSTTCSKPRGGTKLACARTPATTRFGRSRPTSPWRGSRAPRRSRSRPTSSAPRSPPSQRRTGATRRSSRNSSSEPVRS